MRLDFQAWERIPQIEEERRRNYASFFGLCGSRYKITSRWCVTICNRPDLSIVEVGIEIEFLRIRPKITSRF